MEEDYSMVMGAMEVVIYAGGYLAIKNRGSGLEVARE